HRSQVVLRVHQSAASQLTLGVITARDVVARISRLAGRLTAPEIARFDAVGRDDRDAPPEPVVAEAGRAGGVRLGADADQAILGVPGVRALPVVSQITVRIVNERLAVEILYLIEPVISGAHGAGGPLLGHEVAGGVVTVSVLTAI